MSRTKKLYCKECPLYQPFNLSSGFCKGSESHGLISDHSVMCEEGKEAMERKEKINNG